MEHRDWTWRSSEVGSIRLEEVARKEFVDLEKRQICESAKFFDSDKSEVQRGSEPQLEEDQESAISASDRGVGRSPREGLELVRGTLREPGMHSWRGRVTSFGRAVPILPSGI